MQSCSGGGSASLRRNSRLSNRSNSTRESLSQNEKTKFTLHSTRHSSLQRSSDCDIPQKSLYRNSTIKQNSPICNPFVQEFYRYSPKRSVSQSLICKDNQLKNDKNYEKDRPYLTNVDSINANDPATMSDSSNKDIKENIEDNNKTDFILSHPCADDEDSSSVEILPEPEFDEYVHSPSICNSISTLPTATTTLSAAVTIPAVITTTPDNVCTETLHTPVDACINDSNGIPIMSHKRLASVDDDEDKEKAIGTSPDGR